MFTMRVFEVNDFGDLDILAPDNVRVALQHWVLSVMLNHMDDKDACLVDESHRAIEYYSCGRIYDMPKQYVDHVINEMIRYYHRAFDFFIKYDIIHYDVSTPFHEGVFIVTRD